MVNTPVLYITFARPEYAIRSFAAIKKAQPRKLYFYSNKAREDRADEVKRNQEVRSLINQVDWECDVKTWFRDEYVDVFTSLWGAIDWVFNNEPEAIIIEEDVVATEAFWGYCDTLLPRYVNNKSVRMISGNNLTPEFNPKGVDYFFTHQLDIYGWASWSDRWKSLDRKMIQWPEIRRTKLKDYFDGILCRLWYRLMLDRIYKRLDTYNPWDYISVYNSILNNQCGIIPMINLTWDIGVVGANSTVKGNEKKDEVVIPEIESISLQKFPTEVRPYWKYDYFFFYKRIFLHALKYFPRRIIQKLMGK